MLVFFLVENFGIILNSATDNAPFTCSTQGITLRLANRRMRHLCRKALRADEAMLRLSAFILVISVAIQPKLLQPVA